MEGLGYGCEDNGLTWALNGQMWSVQEPILSFGSDAYVRSSLDAISIHGGKGYLTETEIERDLRDATGGVLYTGTSDI
jgi:hypothetical protein